MTASSAAAASSASTRDVLVIGEAVQLDLRPASPFARVAAFALDAVVQLGLLIGLTMGLFFLMDRWEVDETWLSAAALTTSLLAIVGYPVLMELLTQGRSLGRLAVGTRVVRDDGGPLHVRHILLRAVMGMFELWGTSGALAMTVSVVDHRSRRLGDVLAGTMVVQERLRARGPARPEMPTELAGWAREADISALPQPLLQEIRAFVSRAATVDPALRREVGLGLLQRTLPSVSPPPPLGTEPTLFLQAVLAERSRRDEERLRHQDARRDELAARIARENTWS